MRVQRGVGPNVTHVLMWHAAMPYVRIQAWQPGSLNGACMNGHARALANVQQIVGRLAGLRRPCAMSVSIVRLYPFVFFHAHMCTAREKAQRDCKTILIYKAMVPPHSRALASILAIVSIFFENIAIGLAM